MRFRFRTAPCTLLPIALTLFGCASDDADQANADDARVGTFWFLGEAVELKYHQVGDLKIFEGDIVLDPESEIISVPGEAVQPILAAASANLWDKSGNGGKGVVPFVIDSSIDKRGRIDSAIQHWEAKTSMRFVEFDPSKHTSHVLFVNANQRAAKYQNACWSSVGRRGGKQDIVLDEDICTSGLIVHEIGHAVGLLHEHTRSDRDQYVRYFPESTKGKYQDQFDKRTCSNGGTLCDYEKNKAYDIKSIMHYASTYFYNDTPNAIGKPWTLAKREDDGKYSRIYNDGVLSPKDIEGIQRLYGFSDTPAPEPEPDPEPTDPSEFPVAAWMTGTLESDGSCMGGVNGGGITMADCSSDDLRQNWNMDALRHLRNHQTDLCAEAAAFSAGSQLSQASCDTGDLQQWRFLNMEIVNGKTGNCLEVASYAAGEPVTYQECDPTNGKQRFHYSPVSRQIFANMAQTMCLHATVDGAVELHACDGASARQEWMAGHGGFVSLATESCLAVAGSNVVVAACSGNVGQMWGMRGNIRLYSESSYCLRAGAHPTLAVCDAGDEMQAFTYWMNF